MYLEVEDAFPNQKGERGERRRKRNKGSCNWGNEEMKKGESS